MAKYLVVGSNGAGPISDAVGAPIADQTLIGNVSGATADAAALTVAQVLTMLGLSAVLKFKGSTDCSGNPNYPSAAAGDAYVVTVAGKIGGAAGTVVEIGDVYFANAANAGGTEAAVGTSWDVLQANLAGITAAGLAMIQAATAAAQTALLSNVTGDSGAGGVKGLVPAPAAGDTAAGKFLKADATWVAIATGQANWIAADGGAAPTVAPTAAGADAIAIGDNTVAGGAGSVILGSGATDLGGANGVAVGAGARGEANCTALGRSAIAGGSNAVAIGYEAYGDGTSSIVIGTFANSGATPGVGSIAIGSDVDATDNTQSTGTGSIAIGSAGSTTGDGARASGTSSIAIGGASAAINGALASAIGAIALGGASEADGVRAIALGHYANSGITAGDYSIAVGADDSSGDNTQAVGSGSIAIGSSRGSTGDGARTADNASISIGCGGTTTGNGAFSNTNNAIAIGSAGTSGNGANAAGSGQNIAIGSGVAALNGALANNSTASIAIGGSDGVGPGANAGGAGCIAIGPASSTNTSIDAIAIGRNTDATGANTVAIGGNSTDNQSADASAANAIALGSDAFANRVGEMSMGLAGRFAAQGDARTSLVAWRGQTTDATPTEIFLRGSASNRLSLASDSVMAFRLNAAIRRTDADNESGYLTIAGCIDNNAGTTAAVGVIATTPVGTDFATATVVASADNANDALAMTVTGEVGKTIDWVVWGEITQITA